MVPIAKPRKPGGCETARASVLASLDNGSYALDAEGLGKIAKLRGAYSPRLAACAIAATWGAADADDCGEEY